MTGAQPSGGLRLQSGSNAGLDCRIPGWKYNRALCTEYCHSADEDLNKLCQEKRLKKALQELDLKVLQGHSNIVKVYVRLLQCCARMKSVTVGKLVHAHIIKHGIELNIFLGNILIDMYVKCGSLLDACQAFNQMSEHNVFSWTVIISTYNKQGKYEEAINLFDQMQQTGIMPDKVLFLVIIKACASLAMLDQGKLIHDCIINSGFELDVFVGSTLVDMYVKCGSIEDAREVFNKMGERDVVLWNVMIAGYAQNGNGEEALRLFTQMLQEGMEPDSVTFVSVLKACASLAALEQGKKVHAHAIKSGFELDIFVGNTLIDMYAKCGSIDDARQVFSKMCYRDVVSWNAMISGYVQHSFGEEALVLFDQMQQEGVKPDCVTFLSILKACSILADLEWGKQIHGNIIARGFESDTFVANTLVDMYAKCGSVEEARKIFNRMNERGIVSWNAMISGYAQQGHGQEALALFKQMQEQAIKPDSVTFMGILKACINLADLECGRQIHGQIIRNGFESITFVGNTLIDMYAKCGSIEDAWQVFNKLSERDLVSWNAMIAGYAQQGHAEKALVLFEQMQLEGIKPDNVTFIAIIKACASLEVLDRGKEVHGLVIKSGFESNGIVGNTLVDMYAKCGSMEDACEVFNKLHERDIFSWTPMIAGYVQQGYSKKALRLFEQMQHEGVKPNYVTFLVILKACVSMASLECAKQFHALIIKCGLQSDPFVGNALVDTYAKCGSMEDALQVFNGLHKQNVVSWTALIAGYVQEGHPEEALSLFKQMQKEGMEPNHVTYMSILKACASLVALEAGKQVHAHVSKSGFEFDSFMGISLLDMYAKCGSIEDARLVFDEMRNKAAVSGNISLWNAMIAGHAQQGHGEEALALFNEMQHDGMKPNEVTFVCILSACSNAGLVGEGCYHFKSMSQAYGVMPTMEHYACMIDLFGRSGRLEEAHDFINNISTQPNAVVWMALLGACRNHGNADLGKRAFEQVLELEPNCTGAYVLLANIYAAVGKWDEVLEIRKRMENTGANDSGQSWIEA